MKQQIIHNHQLSNQNKLSIIKQLYNKYKTKTVLYYQYQPQSINNPQQKTQYLYKANNSNIIKRVNHQIISQKKEDYIKQAINLDQQQNDDKQNYRYFHDDLTCAKCGYFGHSKIMCPYSTKCLYCLSTTHKTDKCSQKNICFKCNKFGHSMLQCSIRQNYQQCVKCQRNHIGKCYFLTRRKDRNKKMVNMDSVYSSPQLKCIKCGYIGHLICKG